MRILGIDYGSKRVGLAISDEAGQFALPHSVMENSSLLADEIEKICLENNVHQVVIGESKNYKGQPNAIFAEAEKLRQELTKRGLEIHMEPEFMTSVQAERFQGKNKMSDASAAALILQAYLDKK